jgi:hypothetical protein
MSVLILSSHLCLRPLRRLFSSIFQLKYCMHFPTTGSVHVILPTTLNLFGTKYHANYEDSRYADFSSLLLCPLSLRINYFLGQPILKHLQPTLFPTGEQPRFTSIHNNKRVYSLSYILIFIFFELLLFLRKLHLIS